jgi:integrase
MAHGISSAGGGSASCGTEQTGLVATEPASAAGGFSLSDVARLPTLPQRAGALTIRDLIDLYMAHYTGRDGTRLSRLTWWVARIGGMALQDLSDDDVHAALEDLTQQRSRYFAGKDADDRPIYKAKRKTLAPATINRYSASLAAVLTWSIKRRVAPRGFVHPCRSVERREENNERVRFLSDVERDALLAACKKAPWPRLNLVVLMALTTGARKGELLGMRWSDVDFDRSVASVGRTKNGDPRVLPLVPAVVDELRRFEGAASSLVFPSPRNPRKAFGFEAQWQAAMEAAGVRRFRFHDLRHSCASYLAQSGATLLEIGDVLGHRQLSVTKRYCHLTVNHKTALVNRVLGQLK